MKLQRDDPPETAGFSVYSCSWLASPSRPDPVEIILDGTFELAAAAPEFSILSRQGIRTVLTCSCPHGLTYVARLKAIPREG